MKTKGLPLKYKIDWENECMISIPEEILETRSIPCTVIEEHGLILLLKVCFVSLHTKILNYKNANIQTKEIHIF